MKLTTNEMKLLLNLSKRRRRRKWDAWSWFLSTIGLMIATYGYGFFPSLTEWPILGMAAGLTLANLVHVYFAVRPEDKLVELLQRYVNRDPEAVKQLAGVIESDAVAA